MYEHQEWKADDGHERNTASEPNRDRGKRKQPGWKRSMGLIALCAVCVLSSGAISYRIATSANAESAATASALTVQAQTVSTTTSTATAGSIADIVEKVADSVVEVSTEMKQVNPIAREYVTEGAGSGVILSEDGYIVTNHHVIDGASSITVRTTDGTEYSATLVGSDEQTDIAVLKIEASGLTYATLADSDQVKVGDLVIAIGNPLGELGGTVTDGIVSATDREVTIENQTMTLMQTSAAVSPGNSGGGLFDSEGNLIGVVNAKSSGSGVEGLAFAVPSNTVTQVVEDLIQNGYVTGRPQLGISVTEQNASRGGMWGQGGQGRGGMRSPQQQPQTEPSQSNNEPGVYVVSTTAGNGLEEGDRIISIDGVEVSTGSEIKAIVNDHQVGDVLRVVVDRDGEQVEVDVTLTESVPVAPEAEAQVQEA